MRKHNPLLAKKEDDQDEERDPLMNRIEDKYFVHRKHLDTLTAALAESLTLGDIDTNVRFNLNRTIYLDNQDLDLFRNCIHNVTPRVKIRIRQYAPNAGEWESVAYMEFKIKQQDGNVEKVRIRIFGEWVEGIAKESKLIPFSDQLVNLNRDIDQDQLKARVEQVNACLVRYGLREQLTVQYRRRAYSGKNLRVTVDDEIMYQNGKPIEQGLVDSMRASKDWNDFIPDYEEFRRRDYLVLEVKHTKETPNWLLKLLRSVGAREVKFSKYCAAVVTFVQNGQQQAAAIQATEGKLHEVIRGEAEPTEFLPDDLVMLDCEMTCVQPKRDDLLQVAMLKLKRNGYQYEVVGEPLVLYLKTDRKPETGFHKKYLAHIFELCNKSTTTPEMAKQRIESWLGDLRGRVTPTGDCVPTDVAFLLEKGLITAPDIVDDKPVPGTFHYEFADMNLPKAIARHKLRRKETDEEIGADKENIHDALVDCQNQLLELNFYLKACLDNPAIRRAKLESGLNVPFHTALMDLYDCCSEKDYNFHRTQDKIPKDAIYAEHPYQTDFPDGRETLPHVTVLYGLKNEEDFFPIRKYFAEQDPFKFRIGPIKAFRNADKPYDVLVAAIESEDLKRHHWHIRDNHDTNNSFPDYKPHMTLAYINKGTCKELEGQHDWQGCEYTCPVIKFSHTDDFKIDMPLRKPQRAQQPYVGWGSAEDGTGIYDTKPETNEQVIERIEAAHRDRDKLPHIKLKPKKTTGAESTLPPELAPAVNPVPLPNGLDPKEIQRRYRTIIMRADSFQDFQEVLNRIMVENELLEEFRPALAGALNSLRVREGYQAL